MKPKLNELETFIAVAESNSFNLAAERKGIAASVVSRSIKNLEQDLKVTLFNRTTRSVSLTEEGKWLLAKAQSIFDEYQTIKPHFQALNTHPAGKLTIDAASPFVLHVIVPLLPAFKAQYPNLHIDLVSNESITDLLESKVDVAIRIGKLNDSTLKARKLGVTQRGLYASSMYLKLCGDVRAVSDLEKHSCLGFSTYTRLNQWPILDNNNEKLLITACMQSNNGETLKQMALNHLGIVCLSQFAAQKEVKSEQLIPVLQREWIEENIPIYAVYYSERHQSARIRVFIDFLVEHLRL